MIFNRKKFANLRFCLCLEDDSNSDWKDNLGQHGNNNNQLIVTRC